jgi:hypothetical protein
MEAVAFDLIPEQFSADIQRRTITGVLIPWGSIGRHKSGRRWRFSRGSIVYGHAKYLRLNDEHDQAQRLGRAIDVQDTELGLIVTFKIDPGPAGDRALALAATGEKTGLSAELEMDTADFGRDPAEPGVRLVTLANLTGAGHVRDPAFDDSRIINVSYHEEGAGMPGTEETTEDTAAAATTPAVTATITQPAAEPAAPVPVMFSAEQVQALIAGGVGILPTTTPAPAARPIVNGNRPVATTQVVEALPYRFARVDGKHVFSAAAEHDFSTDVFAAINPASSGPEKQAAQDRVNALIRAAFAVDAADVLALTPNQYRPDLWQPQMDYATPLWNMINSGSTDGRKFDLPKYDSSSGLVGPATPGTEPAPGNMQVTSQTVTPTQVWGKVEIERQSWRAGGSPQFSGILWDQMLREYFEDREAAVATFLNTLTAATDITVTGSPAVPTNDNDQASAASLEAAIADLQFTRGGNRFRAFAVHQALYRLLTRVTDDAGRPLYPRLNPTNANGTAAELFATLNVAGVLAVPAWALGSAGGNTSVNSWMFDPAKVRGWASAPERLDWNFGATVQSSNIPQLSHVTVGIYGDIALANLDIAGVRQVIFDQNTAA